MSGQKVLSIMVKRVGQYVRAKGVEYQGKRGREVCQGKRVGHYVRAKG